MDLFNKTKLKTVTDQLVKTTKEKDGYKKDVDRLNKVIGDNSVIIENKNSLINELYNTIEHQNNKLIITEEARRRNACALGGKSTYISKLKKDHVIEIDNLNNVIADKDDEILQRNLKLSQLSSNLEKANNKIIWLQKNTRAPSFDEINAYDNSQKEVERRQKNKKEHDINSRIKSCEVIYE